MQLKDCKRNQVVYEKIAKELQGILQLLESFLIYKPSQVRQKFNSDYFLTGASNSMEEPKSGFSKDTVEVNQNFFPLQLQKDTKS